MLTGVSVRDYKSYEGETEVRLKPLTIFLGKNNSGKTALARLPLQILSGIASTASLDREPLPLAARKLSYGSSTSELVHGRALHGRFSVGLERERAGHGPARLSLTVQTTQSRRTGRRALVTEFEASPSIGPISWLPRSRDGEDRYDPNDVDGFDGILPVFTSESGQQAVAALMREALTQLREYVHLSSLRSGLEPIYQPRSAHPVPPVSGEDAPYLLATIPGLIELVSDWYSRVFAVPGVRVYSDAQALSIVYGDGLQPKNVAQSGQGIQQILPVVTYLLGMTSEMLPYKTIVVEEPELNLHPGAHGAVADLFVALAERAQGAQVIVETHSENFVLRVRRAVAAGRLDPDRVGLVWFEMVDGATTAREIELRPDGSVGDWPSGVFSEDLAEARAIAREARSAAQD